MNSTFEILLREDYFNKNDILSTSENNKLKVISVPKKHYSKWYFKLLNIITFKLFFNIKYTYTVKILK